MSSTPKDLERTPVLNVVSIDYIRLATWNFQTYLKLSAKVRQKYVGWRTSKWLQYTMERSPEMVSYGLGTQKDQGHGLFEASGAAAHVFLHWLINTQQEFLSDLYCTRIDLQCTKQRPDSLDYVKTHKRLRKPRELILGNDGNTLYIGNRESDSFWRLYDKTEKHLRLEVELKGKQARQAWGAFKPGEQIAPYYNALVKRSRTPKYIADHYADTEEVTDLDAFAIAAEVNYEKQLQWIATLDTLVYKLANDHDVGERMSIILERWNDYAKNT